MDYTRIMIKELLKINKNDKISFRINYNGALEYFKWLSYIPDFEKKEIEVLLSKKNDDLTSEELSMLKNYKKQKELIPKFKRYISDECLKGDVLPIYDFMQKHSIDKIIKSKLTKKEINKANKIINQYKNLPLDELANFINELKEKNTYLELSMIESYALRELDNFLIFECKLESESILEKKLERNAFMRAKSYEKADRPLI